MYLQYVLKLSFYPTYLKKLLLLLKICWQEHTGNVGKVELQLLWNSKAWIRTKNKCVSAIRTETLSESMERELSHGHDQCLLILYEVLSQTSSQTIWNRIKTVPLDNKFGYCKPWIQPGCPDPRRDPDLIRNSRKKKNIICRVSDRDSHGSALNWAEITLWYWKRVTMTIFQF